MLNPSSVPMDDESVKLGLLMETAQSHQKVVEALLGKLNEHTEGLDAMVRDQIHHVLVEELQIVRAETQGAVEALQALKRAANARTTLWTLGVTAIALGVALFAAWWVLPTPAEIAALRAERDALASNIAILNQRGARADLRRCGTGHLCVRVDLKAPRYGESSDYLVDQGLLSCHRVEHLYLVRAFTVTSGMPVRPSASLAARSGRLSIGGGYRAVKASARRRASRTIAGGNPTFSKSLIAFLVVEIPGCNR